MSKDLRRKTPVWAGLIDRFMLRLFTGEHFDGLWIGAFNDAKPEVKFARVREALGLIKDYDPLRYRRMTCDLKRVLVCRLPTQGCFNCRIGACELDEGFVLAEATTPELLASTIVHEAAHARLWSYGLGYEEMMRPKVEAICVRRQLAFARKLPNGQQARQWAEEVLTYCTSANLSDTRMSNLNHDWFLEETRRLRVPKCVVRTTTALGKIIQARRARNSGATADR
jgi:hypothetical protein